MVKLSDFFRREDESESKKEPKKDTPEGDVQKQIFPFKFLTIF